MGAARHDVRTYRRARFGEVGGGSGRPNSEMNGSQCLLLLRDVHSN
jgi:hypothetical protein